MNVAMAGHFARWRWGEFVRRAFRLRGGKGSGYSGIANCYPKSRGAKHGVFEESAEEGASEVPFSRYLGYFFERVFTSGEDIPAEDLRFGFVGFRWRKIEAGRKATRAADRSRGGSAKRSLQVRPFEMHRSSPRHAAFLRAAGPTQDTLPITVHNYTISRRPLQAKNPQTGKVGL
jgi:hypothetical protein